MATAVPRETSLTLLRSARLKRCHVANWMSLPSVAARVSSSPAMSRTRWLLNQMWLHLACKFTLASAGKTLRRCVRVCLHGWNFNGNSTRRRVAALLMSAKPDTPVTQIVDALKTTAKHPGGPERRPDNRWGYGIINPVEAFRGLG